MNILLDEGTPIALRKAIENSYSDSLVFTAQRVGLVGSAPEFQGLNRQQKDKKLLELASERNFDVVVTVDQRVESEQNGKTPINVITLDAGHEHNKNYEQHYKPMLSELRNRLTVVDLSVTNNESPSFTRIQYHEVIGGPPGLDNQPDPPEPPKPGAGQMPPSTAKEQEPDWKAKWASHTTDTKIPDRPEPSPSDTITKSKGRSR